MGHYRVLSFQQLSDLMLGKGRFDVGKERFDVVSGGSGHEIKKNGNFALAEHRIEMTKKGRSDILDEVCGLHEVEIKKNGSFTWADHGTLADHGVEIKKNGICRLTDHGIVAN